MNNKLLIAIPIALAVPACAQITPRVFPACHEPVVIIDPQNCHAPGAQKNKQTVNVNNPNLEAVPFMVCTDRGDTIEIKITPPNAGVTVMTVPKDPADTWIFAGNAGNQNLIQIHVPNNIDMEKEYKYSIISSNMKCLDPVFHVD